MTLEQAKDKLEKFGQQHLLAYYDELDKSAQEALLEQIQSADMSVVRQIADKESLNKKGLIEPLAAMELDEIEANKNSFYKTGIEALRAGKLAAVLLAGGMGTRLGSDAPKGMYNIGRTKELFIFECLFKNLMEVTKDAGANIHLFVMTSEKNHNQTVAFLKEKKFFGYDESFVHFFKQEMAPAADYNGKIYLEEKGRIATSPNGNGGWFVSLKKAGYLDLLHKNKIEWLNIFAVDNVLQRIADPLFVGATIQKGCSVGSKVVRKAAPDEKVGVMCLEDKKPSIVEYYELSREMMDAKDANGNPAYNFGVILNYLFNLNALEKLADGLPLHIVEKKIPYIDKNGNLIKPDKPNGYKFENLVLDMIHKMDSCLPFEVVRQKEFAPIKNASGVDSVQTAQELLKQNGVEL